MMPAGRNKVKLPEKPKLLNESDVEYIGWGLTHGPYVR